MFKIVICNLGYNNYNLCEINGYQGLFKTCIKKIQKIVGKNPKKIDDYNVININYNEIIKDGIINIIDTIDYDRGIYLVKLNNK